MIQKTYIISNIDEIAGIAAEIHGMPVFKEASCKVLLAWSQRWNRDGFAEFRDEIVRLFPDLITIGCNHHNSDDILNGILDGPSEGDGCLLTFLLFEQSGASLYGIEPARGEEEREGCELRDLILNTEIPSGVYIVPPDYYNSTEDVLKELKDITDVPVFGLKTSLHEGYSNFGYEPGREMMEGRLFALIFHGEALKIRVHYNLGWTPVGKTMTVTKEENPFFVDEIDGKAASYVYNKYLGLRNDQIIPGNLSEFPLILERDGLKMSRIGIAGPKEGQLVFGAPVHLNDKVGLSYGNPDDLFSEVVRDCNDIAEFKPEAGLLIICANRVMLLKKRESEEVDIYRKQIKEAAAIYGYGEEFYINGKGGELNSALVSVAFKEVSHTDPECETYTSCGSDAKDNAVKTDDVMPLDSPIVPFPDRLSRMFKEMSKDLVKAVKEAEDANRAKSVFYSTVSHEIRTNLNTILGMNEMILKESGDDAILGYAGNIKGSGKVLQQLINDILDIGKLEAGKMEIVPVNYDVKEVMDELAAMAEYSAKEKGLELKYSVDEDLPYILQGDEKRIRQCILNLLNNAVKYTPEGEIIFKVRCSIEDEEHAILDISVKDSGIGIKPEDIEKLSIPFERVDSSKNYKVEGTGLGLNIVNNLLSLMGSKLEIRSIYGRGSRFSFAISQKIIRLTDDGERESHNAGSPEDSWGNLKTRDTSILVVDDTPMNHRIVRLFLKDSLIDIDTAQDGYTGIEMAKNKKYDIILLDHRMPDIDGLEVYKRIRADAESANSDSIFIMLTAEDGQGVRERFMEEGFADFMPKPFQPPMLEAIIRKHLPNDKIIS